MQNKGQNETQGKINYSYLLNKIMVSHTSTIRDHGIYECITVWCVFELLRTTVYWLPTYWEIYEMQYLGYLSVRRYNSVNSFSIAYTVVFQMPQFMPHGMCPVHACYSGVLCLHLSHCALELWDMTATKMRMVEREGCICRMQCPAVWSRISDAAMQPLIGAAASTRRLLVHNWIDNLLRFTQVFNIVISLSSTSHYLMFVSLLQFMCIYTMIT